MSASFWETSGKTGGKNLCSPFFHLREIYIRKKVQSVAQGHDSKCHKEEPTQQLLLSMRKEVLKDFRCIKWSIKRRRALVYWSKRGRAMGVNAERHLSVQCQRWPRCPLLPGKFAQWAGGLAVTEMIKVCLDCTISDAGGDSDEWIVLHAQKYLPNTK